MTNTATFEKAESFCVVLFALSVFIWKPGIYVSCGLISLYLIVRVGMDEDYRRMLLASRFAKLSLLVFVLGLVTASLGADDYLDVGWMARKTLFIPAVIFLVFALKRQLNQQVAMTALVVSFWLATVFTLWQYDWQMQFGERMEGPWPQGTWDSLLGLFFPFMVLYMGRNELTRATLTVFLATTAMAFVMLLLAGGRAPWLASFIGLVLYFLVFKRKREVLLGLVAIAVVAVGLGLTVFTDKTRPLIDRVTTITDTTTNESNWVRLQLWNIGIQQFADSAQHDPMAIAFGGGALSYDAKQIEFFETMPYDPEDRQRLKTYGFPTGDTHNTYLDNALRHGVIWTVIMLLYLVGLCTEFKWRYIKQNPEPTMLLIGLLVIGMFYTVVPHFATFFFVLFVALLRNKQPFHAGLQPIKAGAKQTKGDHGTP